MTYSRNIWCGIPQGFHLSRVRACDRIHYVIYKYNNIFVTRVPIVAQVPLLQLSTTSVFRFSRAIIIFVPTSYKFPSASPTVCPCSIQGAISFTRGTQFFYFAINRFLFISFIPFRREWKVKFGQLSWTRFKPFGRSQDVFDHHIVAVKLYKKRRALDVCRLVAPCCWDQMLHQTSRPTVFHCHSSISSREISRFVNTVSGGHMPPYRVHTHNRSDILLFYM